MNLALLRYLNVRDAILFSLWCIIERSELYYSAIQVRQYIQPSQAASEAPFTHVIRLITIYSRRRVKTLLGILFRKLLGSYAISTADRGGIDLAAAGTLYTFAYRSGMRTLGALK